MKVKANARGYYGGRLIEPDTEFEIASEDELGTWMDQVDEPEAKPEKPAKAAK